MTPVPKPTYCFNFYRIKMSLFCGRSQCSWKPEKSRNLTRGQQKTSHYRPYCIDAIFPGNTSDSSVRGAGQNKEVVASWCYATRTCFLSVSPSSTLGYVTSILGRRRPLPRISAQDQKLRAQAERQAVNFVVQGTRAPRLPLPVAPSLKAHVPCSLGIWQIALSEVLRPSPVLPECHGC